MKIVVIGGSGLIGTKVVSNLRQRGHEVVAASPSTGVNTLTGEGLAKASRRSGRRRCGELTFVRRQALHGLLRNVGSQSSWRRENRGRETSRGVVGGGHRSPDRKRRRFVKRLFPRETCPGKPDQGFRHSVYDRPGHAVLRICEGHRPIRG